MTADRLVLLGTAGGPSAVAGRVGIGHVLVVEDHTYVVDAGRSAVTQYVDAGLSMSALSAMFVTHLHADHVADYATFLLHGGQVAGGAISGFSAPLAVYGPGSAGALPPYGQSIEHAIGGANFAPGLADHTRLLLEANAYHLNLFAHPQWDLREVIRVHEIAPPTGWDPGSDPPLVAPIPVMEDDRVRVTATVVPHNGCLTYAFRFDTERASVVFSGDTGPAAPNLLELAAGATFLVHEVMDVDALAALGVPPLLLDAFREGHTDVNEVGRTADAAGVSTLVLDHFVPAAPGLVAAEAWHDRAQVGYHGDIVVGSDLMQVELAPATARR